MARLVWKPWLLASALVGLAMPVAAARADEAPTDAAPNVVCTSRALRIGAAELNGFVRSCEDPATHTLTTPPTLVLETTPADGTPVTYTPLPDAQLSNAAASDNQEPDAAMAPDPQP